MSNYLNNRELELLGLKSFGENVLISKDCKIYNPKNISIGSNVRIDDFCLLSAGNEHPFIIDSYVHISAGCYIFGAGGFHMKDYTALSGGSKVYTISDDYCGKFFTNPMCPIEHRNVIHGPVIFDRYVVVGCNSVILPNVNLAEGVAVGANSLVLKNCEEWKIYGGSPARIIKERYRDVKNIEI